MLPSNQRTNFRSGFTFVEVLAAMFFMALVVPVVMHGFALANRALYALMTSRPHATMKHNPPLQIAVHKVITQAMRIFCRDIEGPAERRRAVMKVYITLYGGISLAFLMMSLAIVGSSVWRIIQLSRNPIAPDASPNPTERPT